MDLWLVEETSRYMFLAVAVKEIFKNPQRYGFLLKRNTCTRLSPTKR